MVSFIIFTLIMPPFQTTELERGVSCSNSIKTGRNKLKEKHPNELMIVKGTVHYQKIFLKYLMLRTITKNSTIIITKYTWYHRCREIIQITGGPPLRLRRKPDSKAGRRKLKCSDVTWAISRLTQMIVSLER